MEKVLSSIKVIALASPDFEDLELWYPVYRLREAGAQVDIVSETAGETFHGKNGVPVTSDLSFKDIDYKSYDGILVPGGWSPDKLRRYDEVIEMIQYFDKEKKPIGQICHAGWVLISADILEGVNVTSTPGIKDDMRNAGAIWQDISAIRDGHIVSSQRPVDLPNYAPLLIEAFEEYLDKKK
ncbi:MAG: type 1 glutamine amidotransferase domain-containing protein [Saccharofermentanales bacterium]|jgi:protease I